MSIRRSNRMGINNTQKRNNSLQSASGLPSAPQNIVVTPTGTTTASISWSAPAIIGDSAITGYTVTGGGTPSVVGTSATVTGLTANTQYTFSVMPTNSVGNGRSAAAPAATTLPYNLATGGTVTDVSNYLGTGQTWRIHTFSSPGTLSVTTSSEQFKTVVAGGGGGGGGEGSYYARGGAGGAGVGAEANITIPTGSQSITVGGGGGGASPLNFGGGGGPSSIAALTSQSGGGGGAAGHYGGYTGSPNGPTISSNIAGGSPVNYSGGGGAGWSDPSFTAYPGGAGSVVVAYRIA